MPCDTKPLTPTARDLQRVALERLAAALAAGSVVVNVGPQGAIAFRGWTAEDRNGLADVCAYRKLLAAGSPELRRAVVRAEGIAGRKVDARAIAAGVHSHDGGEGWHHGH